MKFTHSLLVYNLSYRIICYSRLCTEDYSLPITINISTEQISFWETNSLQLVKNFIVFHGHKKFITGFTSACKLFLFWAKLILSIIRVIKTNLMYYLLSAYFTNQPLHVSGIFVAHYQEVYYIYIQQLVRVMLFSWLSLGRRPTDSQLKSTTRTNCCIYIYYTSWEWATNMPETCRCWLTE
jgi:hypothetical protein